MRKLLTIAVVLLFVTTVTITAQAKNESQQGKKSHRVQECKQAKPYIVKKRNNTWKLQDSVFMDRTRTNYNEKKYHGCSYLRYLARKWESRAHQAYRFTVKLQEPKAAICYVFRNNCQEALNVTWCESRYSIWAENGQYLGLFQMGSSERQLFGHGDTALEQAVAAKRYFDRSGWSPWACNPY